MVKHVKVLLWTATIVFSAAKFWNPWYTQLIPPLPSTSDGAPEHAKPARRSSSAWMTMSSECTMIPTAKRQSQAEEGPDGRFMESYLCKKILHFAVCIDCKRQLIYKKHNIKRHYDNFHKDYYERLTPSERKDVIEALKRDFENSPTQVGQYLCLSYKSCGSQGNHSRIGGAT